jgi:hypothetical protein
MVTPTAGCWNATGPDKVVGRAVSIGQAERMPNRKAMVTNDGADHCSH